MLKETNYAGRYHIDHKGQLIRVTDTWSGKRLPKYFTSLELAMDWCSQDQFETMGKHKD